MNEIDQIAVRLRRLRNAFGFETVRDFAAFLNVNEQAWYHFERGRRVPTIHDAIKVADKTGASLDWIYRGLEHTPAAACGAEDRRRSRRRIGRIDGGSTTSFG